MRWIGATCIVCALTVIFALSSCSEPLEWPDSPLYEDDTPASDAFQSDDVEAVQQALVGHYAHYDAVAYLDNSTKTPMRTFIVSYGFTDFFMEDGKLYQSDRFVRAKQKINQKNIASQFSDDAVQAIKPRIQEVELTYRDGSWQIYRPSTPTLLGITGDPLMPLTTDANDPNIIDADGDGKPGVTVEINIGDAIKGELYILRREIYSNHLKLMADGSLRGHVEDFSEQFVIDASIRILKQPSDPIQLDDVGMSPIFLVPIADDIDTLEELLAIRDGLFPPEPEFPQ